MESNHSYCVGNLSLVTRQFEWVLLKEKIVMMKFE